MTSLHLMVVCKMLRFDFRRRLGWLWSFVAGLATLYLAPFALAQQDPPGQAPERMTAPQPAFNIDIRNAPVVLRADAYAGQPYGVGKFTYRLQAGDEMIDRTDGILIRDTENRLRYPIVARSQFKQFVQNMTGRAENQPTDVHTVWFLFEGETPLTITLEGSDRTTFEVPVEFVRPGKFDRRVKDWWKAFNRHVEQLVAEGDYPPMVQAYLVSLVGKRFGLTPTQSAPRNPDPLLQTFELMFDVESLQTETIESVMLQGVPAQPADQPLPQPIEWSPVVVENLPETIEIEPVAQCVPEECFYLRFGTWGNQVWLQKLMEEYGGDLGRMIQVRGFKYRIQSKFLDQLAIQSTEFDQLFGGQLIDDVAVIGSDTYFDSGSAVGVMLHARNSNALRNNLRGKRRSFAKQHQSDGAEIREIEFGEDTIEFLSTPDNRYRSFYAVSGNCHLVTTSLVLARRFLEAGQGKGSLADTAEYRFARYNLPLDREDTVFVYMPTKFFQNLLTPQYQIELRRRNRISTDMMLLELARMAATNEGQPSESIDAMIQAGYLPQNFGFRPDGGQFETRGEYWLDSIRGRRGFFAPIPDLPLESVTAEEAAWFQQRAEFFANSIRSLDPMFVAIKRYELKEQVERIVFDARVAPFGEDKYGWLISMLGPPLLREVNHMPGDIVNFQLSMKGGTVNPEIPVHQVFAGIQDQINPNLDLRPASTISSMKMLREIPGYLGSWPGPGYMNWLPALGGNPDPYGYTYSRMLKLWRLRWEDFSIISFDQQRLESMKPHLKIVDSERPAQLRLTVGDLSTSNLQGWANSVNYQRSWQTSIANVQLLNLLTQQLRVPPEEAMQVIERMLDVQLVCSLGGEYVLSQLPSGRVIWQSNQWPSFNNPQLPEEHRAPFIKWFRGLQVEAVKAETQFSVHGFLDIQREQTGGELPSFNLFKGFGGLMGGGDKKSASPKTNANDSAEGSGK